ncbi:MAG TPA: tripartite tricarboxylate transporter substrate binding protein [Pseudolabrys sp.]|jgi:tripartite-type tricarboxylate transporter receptor subunit TctC
MLRSLSVVALVVSCLTAAQAQQYPDHPVRVLVGYAAGSGPDIQARTVAHQLSLSLGQSFIVENRTGANGTIAARAVTQAVPDGYTLLFSSSSITPTPYIYLNLGYDLHKDLTPLASIGDLDGILMLVDAKSPIKSVPEFIAYAKKNHIFYGSPGVGNELHLAAAHFEKTAGVTMEHVPYKGASEVMNGLLSGSVQMMFVTPPSVMGLVKDGRVRPIAFTGTKPFPPLPNVPLMKDVLPAFGTRGSWGMFFGPGKMPAPLVQKLNGAIREALKDPSVSGVLQRDGYMPDDRDAPQTSAFFNAEVDRMANEVKEAGIKPN